MSLIAVTGMHREAVLFPKGADPIVSGGSNAGLAAKIDAAVAKGGKAIISLGICGGLEPGMRIGATIIASEVIGSGERYGADRRWAEALTMRLPRAQMGVIAGSDTVVCEPAQKAALHRDTGAVAVDTESHIAARMAAAYHLPFAALRIVSDAAEDRLPPAVLRALDADGKVQFGPVFRAVARNPAQIPSLLRTGRNSDRALKQLLRCFDLLGIGFGCPHLG